MLLSTALMSQVEEEMTPVNSKALRKDSRNKAALPSHNGLEVHRVMVHLATAHLRTIDNLTAADAIMTVVVAARHGVAAVVQALAGHGTAVVVAAACHGTVAEVVAVCHGTAAAVAAKCHGTADVVDAACHGIVVVVVVVVVAAGWTKTDLQIPGMTC